MCLSSPVSGQSQTPAVGQCNGSCGLDSNGNRSASGSTPSGNGELKHRAKAHAEDDNLGYKEENAVYKETPALDTQQDQKLKDTEQAEEEEEYHPQIRWPDLGAQTFLHVGALYGLYQLFYANFYTFLWGECPLFPGVINICAATEFPLIQYIAIIASTNMQTLRLDTGSLHIL